MHVFKDEVIHCLDCKYHIEFEDEESLIYCDLNNNWWAKNGYCSYGDTEKESFDVTIEECKAHKPCFDCKNTSCGFHGKKQSDCPKYFCDRPGEEKEDCDHCSFIDEYIEKMRRFYNE